jgi:hypothetical protein
MFRRITSQQGDSTLRILTAIVTAATVLVFGASAFACDGMKRDQTAAKSDGTVYYPPAESS